MSDSPASHNWIIRPVTLADAAGIARVHVDSWRSTYAGIMPAALLDGLSYADRENMWRNRLSRNDHAGVVLVVENSAQELIGFAAAGPERTQRPDYPAEVWAIYLLEDVQGRGVGKALFMESARRLQQLGFDSLLVWVAADNPTGAFYEALGGVLIDEKEEEYGSQLIRLVAYGWQGLESLLP